MQRQKRINGMNEERENTLPLHEEEESPGRSARHHMPIWCYRLIMKYLVQLYHLNGAHTTFFSLENKKKKIKQKILSSNIFSQMEFKVLKKVNQSKY